jgi:hypothetical protein
VLCEAKPADPDCLLTAGQCEAIALQRQRAIGVFVFADPILDVIRTIAQLPDAALHVAGKRWSEGHVPFGMLLVFLLLNVFVVTRTPIPLWLVALPISLTISSVLFWLIQHALLFATTGFGILLETLMAIVIPHFVLAGLHFVRARNEVQEVVHRTRTVKTFFRTLRGLH